jgi:lipopolysaccharide transport system ATP-binding protein
MSNTAIKVENLSKIYRLGEIGTGTISRDMERWFKTKVLKQEDPFLKIGETNDRANKGTSDIVYSLQDINFEINQGDAVGIIGRNGAGKSTLLKILSRVTTPTTGRINIKGRVASLLEVGTGFHPELTGRENIYLNGAILGMRKREIDRKLDEIIDFSGVERYIDTPVKRYSSGMYVRLAFAVAAHLESEILIVDEVLAVGDSEFQKKCLGKMGEVSKGEGRTVIFVSHNMAAVQSLCGKGIFLRNGTLIHTGSAVSAINKYMSLDIVNTRFIKFENKSSNDKSIQVKSIKVLDHNESEKNELSTGDQIRVEVSYLVLKTVYNLRVAICLSHENGVEILSTSDFDFFNNNLRKPGYYKSVCTLPNNFLNIGKYRLKVDFDIPMSKELIMDLNLEFEIENLSKNYLGKTNANKPLGLIHPNLNWSIAYDEN